VKGNGPKPDNPNITIMEWYYAKNGQQQGPVSEGTLQELFQSGTIQSGDLVWNESLTDWVPLASIPGFAGSGSPSSPAPASGLPATPATIAGGAVISSAVPSGQPSPPTYLWQSIVCVLLCCWPLAIPAIVFGTKVKPAMEAGDYGSALEASNKAKMWCLISFIVGFVLQAVVFGIAFVSGFAEAAQSQ